MDTPIILGHFLLIVVASVSVDVASFSLISLVGRLRHINAFGFLGRILEKKKTRAWHTKPLYYSHACQNFSPHGLEEGKRPPTFKTSFPASGPPDPGKVSEGFEKGSLKGSLKGFRRVLEGF